MDSGRGNLRRRRRAPLGCAREREHRARERAESEGERRGAAGHLQTRRGRLGGKQEVELGRARCRHASAYWQRLKTAASGRWAGPPVGRQVGGQVGFLSLYFLYFSFYFLFSAGLWLF